MDDHISKLKFRFAVTAAPWALKGAPVLLCGQMRPQFERAKTLGYDAIELHLLTPDDANSSEVRQLKEEYGVEVAAVATGLSKLVDNLSFIDDNPVVRIRAVDRIRSFVDWSAELNCGIVIGSLRSTLPDDSRAQCIDRITDCISDILDYAKPAKVPIYLEVINRYESNFLNTAKDAVDYFKNFNNNWLFIHLDTFHMNIEEASTEAAIMLCGARLGHIHFADNTRHACGEGTIDFKKVMGALKRISYSGYISVECLPIPDGITAAKDSIIHIKKFI